MLACINPGTNQYVETRNVLGYVQRASCLVDNEPDEIDETNVTRQRLNKDANLRGSAR